MFERVLFVALILLIAYLLKLTGLFREDHSKAFIDYVIYFSLPALVIQKVREVPLTGEALGVVLLAWISIGLSLFISVLLGKLLGFEGGSLRALVLVSSFGNTAFLGYPFTFALYGDEGLRYAVLYDQLGSFLLVASIGFLIATGRFDPKEVLLFPPFLALVVGLLSRGVQFPEALNTFLDVSGKSLIPIVLFAIGLRFSPSHLPKSAKGTALALGIKMLFVPLLMVLILKGLDLKGLPYRVVLLETSMPPMVMAGVLAIKYGLDEALALSAITLGMLLSFLTVPLIMEVYTTNLIM